MNVEEHYQADQLKPIRVRVLRSFARSRSGTSIQGKHSSVWSEVIGTPQPGRTNPYNSISATLFALSNAEEMRKFLNPNAACRKNKRRHGTSQVMKLHRQSEVPKSFTLSLMRRTLSSVSSLIFFSAITSSAGNPATPQRKSGIGKKCFDLSYQLSGSAELVFDVCKLVPGNFGHRFSLSAVTTHYLSSISLISL